MGRRPTLREAWTGRAESIDVPGMLKIAAFGPDGPKTPKK